MKIVNNFCLYLFKHNGDVLLATAALGLALCLSFDLTPSFLLLFLLLSSVWILYSIDHAFDCFRGSLPGELALRHQLNASEQVSRCILIVAISVLNGTLAIIFLDHHAFLTGAGLFLAILIHLSLAHYLKYPKEVFAALFYTSGIWLFLMSSGRLIMTFEMLGFFLLTFFLVLLNMLALATIDRRYDRRQGFLSLYALGSSSPRRIAVYSFSALCLTASTLLFSTLDAPTFKPVKIAFIFLSIGIGFLYFQVVRKAKVEGESSKRNLQDLYLLSFFFLFFF